MCKNGVVWVCKKKGKKVFKILLIFIRSLPYADGLPVMVGWTFKCVVLSMNLFTRYSNLNLLIASACGESP